VKVISQSGDLPLRRTKDKQYGDAMFHAESAKADKPEYHFEVNYSVTRRERIGYRDGNSSDQGSTLRNSSWHALVRPTRLCQPLGALPISPPTR